MTKTQEVFFALVRAGLWEKECALSSYEPIDFNAVYTLAEEQSVVGLVAAGLEHVTNVKVAKSDILPFLTNVLVLEQRNSAMNSFLAGLIERLRKAGIYTLLVKGQGIAQCYERPMWRACGDIDLLLNANEYEKAKTLLIPMASAQEQEYTFFKHLGLTIEDWVVELHGTLWSRLSKRIDKIIDAVQDKVFREGAVRAWRNGDTDVFLPAANEDVVFVFTHIMHHFFFEGVGLRQICDWCRLLWKYKDKIDAQLLERRLKKMQLMTEWRAFAAYAVDYLGMPAETMPLYSGAKKWSRKAERINTFVLKVGNFGQNQTKVSNGQQPYLVRKFISFWEHLGYTLRQFAIFPIDSIRFFAQVLRSGLYAAVRRE